VTSPALVAVLLVVGVVVLGVPLWWVATSDGLAARSRRVDACAAWVDGRLWRRHDLVRSAVLLVEGFAPAERDVLDDVTVARAVAVAARGGERRRQSGAEAGLGRAVARLLAVAQEYPALRSNAAFVALQCELVRAEEDIAQARQVLNGAVGALNQAVRAFPGSLVARVCGVRPAESLRPGDHRDMSAVRPPRIILPAREPRPLVPTARAQQDDPRPGARP
jgi:LemA protein